MSRAQDRVESLSLDSHSVLKQRPSSSNIPSSYSKSAQSNAPSKSSYKSLLENRNPSKFGTDSRATPREEDDQQRASPSDVLNTGGSASSLSSAASSIFSTNLSAHAQSGSQFNMNNLTPLTHTESSPPGKMLSPRSQKRSYEQMHNGTTTSPYLAPAISSRAVSETITPVQTPPEPNLQARPGPGEVKGYKITLDPEILPNKKDRKNLKPTYREFGAENEPSAPPDPRLAIAGYTTGAYHNKPSKAKVRVAPYVVRRYPLDKYSIGPGRPTKVVVTGFNILTAESKIRSLLGSFGDLDKCENHIDPSTGAPLGVFSATFKDKVSPRKNEVVLKAADAAQRAEKEGSGMRIDQVAIKIETDREGVKCKKYMDRKLAVKRKEQEKFREEELRKRPPPPPSTPAPGLAPPTAPKGPRGPSARAAMAPPSGPAGPRMPVVALAPKPAAHSLVEAEAILPQMKRTPFLFLAHCYVPVLGTTIAHLKKRLRAYDWDAVRCDRTGYFVTYKSSRLGEQECERTYKECHMFPLFTYTMNFELHKKGNRNHVRSPSPEKVAAQSREKEQRRKIRQDDELDFEAEKKERAENLDPVKAALELLMPELRDTIMKEVRAKIALPHIFDCLHPDKHKEKRAKLGLPDPRETEALKPIISLSNQLLASGQQVNRQKLLNKKPFGKFTKQPRDRREELKQPVNVYDERRKRPVQSKARPIVPLHRRLQEYRDEEDSDDERQTTITRDSEGPDSHPVSEIGVSPARFDVEEEGLRTPKAKRRRLEAGWGAESDDEAMELVARRALGHLLDKEPEDMAMGELQQVLSTFPRSSELRQRAAAEVKLRHKAKQDDKLFGIVPPEVEIEPASVDIIIEDAEMRDTVPEPVKAVKKKAGVAKPKKKTKKEALAEEEAAKAEAKAEEEAFKAIEAEEATPAVEEGEEPRAEVLWALSTDAPRKTVEDDPNLLLDIDGWQNMLKDEEDVRFLLEALQTTKAAKITDAKLWAWKEKEFKALNANGARGITNQIARIEGYYVPNPTGSARTEGYKKISQTEKSKYLPHRIRVQKAREEREREAFNDPQKAVEAAKAAAAAKIASTATSRSNRANNRRLINEITISKQALGADADALKFNQLKKRKKLVRFDRSAIHNWGLYAEENIAASDMIIEYVGEKVRQRVADLREINYQKQGIGSSYLFRIDEDTVVDATKKGGIARFINHSCVPNCTAKIIRVDGTKRIVIYALRDIAKNEELTYDYKFEREINSDDRIPCLCGSVGCKGFLN